MLIALRVGLFDILDKTLDHRFPFALIEAVEAPSRLESFYHSLLALLLAAMFAVHQDSVYSYYLSTFVKQLDIAIEAANASTTDEISCANVIINPSQHEHTKQMSSNCKCSR